MSNFVDGEVRISEPLNLVSIALGGVLGEKAGTRVSRVRLDKAGIKRYQKTEEGKCLKPFLIATSSIELDLRQSLRTESVLRYRLGKTGWGNPIFVLLMVECVIFLVLGIAMGVMLEFSNDDCGNICICSCYRIVCSRLYIFTQKKYREKLS